ncbi:MAG: enoyl-CoA hydratase/isomerase family protein [Propionibacteriaceae bacterium]|jgi:enoyl-CoA hydratase|nr:enoyl-CoA hydratase/isomerase family protein [Propionibacteriaceae bacterium]
MELESFRLDIPEPGVAVVTFDRPPVNAQNRRSREELIWLLDEISERDDIAVVVLTGQGQVFSAGADIKERSGMTSGGADYLRHNRITREFFYAVNDCKKPIIGAINGAAIGAGYALLAGCDILIASDQAWIQMPELDRGLMGGAKFLEKHLPRAVARMLFFTSRKLDAAHMAQYGLVVDLVPPDQLLEAALSLARDIARKHWPAVQKAKAAFNAAEDLPYRDGYRFEQTITAELAGSAYTVEAQRAFLEKRPADYSQAAT